MTDWTMSMFVSGILRKLSRPAASTQMLAEVELIFKPLQM